MVRDAFVSPLCVAVFRASGAEQTRHGPRDAFVRFVAVLKNCVDNEQTRHMDRDAFVPRLCVAGSRAFDAEQTRHGLRDAFLFAVTVLINLFTKDKRVTWSVTRLFGVFALMVLGRPTQTKRVTV